MIKQKINQINGSIRLLILIVIILLFIVGGLPIYYFWWLPIDQPTKPIGVLAPLPEGIHPEVIEKGKEILKHLKRYSIEDTLNWNIYSNSEVNFTFKYPKDWEIIDDYFYETLEGVKSPHRTVILHKINGSDEDWIVINLRQFAYESASVYIEIDGNYIATISRDPNVLDIFYKLIKTIL